MGAAGAVDRELLVVYAYTVTVGVGVGEKARLEDWVGRGFNARNHMGGVEGCLLDFGKVVLSVVVELEDADFAEGKLLMWPDVGQVKDIDLLLLPELFGFFSRHGLERDGPGGIFFAFDGFEEVFLGVVRGVVGRVFLGDELGALV